MSEVVDAYLKSKFPDMRGEAASPRNIGDIKQFARDLGLFLYGLRRLDPSKGALPSFENNFAGSSLEFFEAEIDDQLQTFKTIVPRDFLLVALEKAIKKSGKTASGWLLGNLTAKNVLVTEGKLSGILSAERAVVGDPACDLSIAWFLFDGHVRKIFFGCAEADDAMILRARMFALLHALKTYNSEDIDEAIQARDALSEILEDLDYNGGDELFDSHLPEV
ncbi:MAG: phosphotransferase [Streptococcaceae bacterium]|jgi:aminoglycoside phosphotransferase (APT) family kinase protein|nr:phosphotransferase [Streptococcaceae bacterium]